MSTIDLFTRVEIVRNLNTSRLLAGAGAGVAGAGVAGVTGVAGVAGVASV